MASRNSFYSFLQSECLAIAALVDEVNEYEMSVETIHVRMTNQVSRYPELQSYFDYDGNIDVTDMVDKIGNEAVNIITPLLRPWSRSVRVVIVDHLFTMDINISLLIEIVENYRFKAEIEELVEVVRSLDILGAERRLLEYEAILYMKLMEMDKNEEEWERIYGERLPAIFFRSSK
jgi:hypothetical protein